MLTAVTLRLRLCAFGGGRRTSIAGAWFFTAITIALLAYEYRRFIKLRFTWLTLPRTHNYSIMVRRHPAR